MRIKILVEVDTDLVLGWGHEPEDYIKLLERLLDQTIPHYNPVVTLLPVDDLVKGAKAD